MAATKSGKACPAGHVLKAWSAERGSCDGCRRLVRDGDLVMDCRECNYYLCNECYNGRGSLWVALASFIPDCTADARGNAAATEVVFDDEADCEPTPVVDPRCNRRQQKGEGSEKPPAAPEDAQEANEPEAVKKPEAAESKIESVDLLGDLLAPQPAASTPAAAKHASTSGGPLVDLLGPAELAAPADLDLLGAKGKGAAAQLTMQPARLGAA